MPKKTKEDASLDNASKDPGLARLLEIALMHRAATIAACILSATSAVTSFLPYLAIYRLIRAVLTALPDLATLSSAEVLSCGLLAIGGALGTVALYFMALALSHVAAYGTLYDLKIAFAQHITRLPLGFHINTGSGALRKVMDENIDSIEGFVAHQLPDIVAAGVSPLVMLALLFGIDWRFGLAALVGVLAAFVVQGVLSGNTGQKEHMARYQAALEDMSTASVEYIRGITVVKAFGQTAYSFGRLRDAIKRYTMHVIPYMLGSQNVMAANTAILNSIYLFIIAAGVIIGQGTAGYMGFAQTFLFYIVFTPAIASIVMKALFSFIASQQVLGNVRRMDEILALPAMPEPVLQTSQVPATTCDVHFDDVSFTYDKSTTKALDKVSFTARQGEITAIVGASGSGKTTVAHLIARFFDVDSGSIAIGGVDIRELPLASLMDTVSFVFQDTFLFRQTILENLRVGCPGATEADVIEAAKAARCHDFIETLPDGYQTCYGSEGIHLSGGEMQRLAIARAIVRNTPVLVLDEATAFADPQNEYLIRQALGVLMQGRTTIMIAHRLSTIKDAEKIVVMDAGHIVATGRHESLLTTCEYYRRLWDSSKQALEWKLAERSMGHAR